MLRREIYWFTASTSFANPVVTMARAVTNTFAGIRPVDVPVFIVAQLAGVAAATLLFRWLLHAPAPAAERGKPTLVEPAVERKSRDEEGSVCLHPQRRPLPVNRLVVVGGSDAGISAALRARELEPTWSVTMVVADRFPNYSICGLPFYLSGETPRSESLAHRTLPEIEGAGIEVKLDTVAENIDAVKHEVSVRSSDGIQRLAYDRLVIATGAEPAPPDIPGLANSGVFVLHTMADSFAVERHLRAGDVRRAVIVGGGYIGLEMADALRHRGIEVTLFEYSPTVLQTVDSEFGLLVRAELERHGVDVRTGTRALSVEASSGRNIVRTDGGSATAELVLVVTGVRPCAELGIGCGVATGVRGALRTNRCMETNVRDVFAAGDCVETHHRLLKLPAYLPLGTTAHKQGRVAGANAVGSAAEFQGSLGTQVVKVKGLIIGRTGLRDAEAVTEGWEPLTVETVTWDHKAYYPGATEVRIRVTADRRTHRLLGAQLLGSYGAEISKRIDVFAVALFHEMAVDGVADLDLSYTPPLSSPWDPVQIACMAWLREERQTRVR